MLIRDMYDERGKLVVKDFDGGLTGAERDHLDYLTTQLHRWQEIRYRIWKLGNHIKELS